MSNNIIVNGDGINPVLFNGIENGYSKSSDSYSSLHDNYRKEADRSMCQSPISCNTNISTNTYPISTDRQALKNSST